MVDIVEIQQQMTQGMTKPWLCAGDDGNQYVVKRLNAGLNGCIYEWISANLGKKLGLNIPDPELVYIDEPMVEFDIDLQTELGSGVAFASKYHHDLNEVNFNELIKADKSKLVDLYIFDYWLKNDDRTLTERGGNPNLFQDLISKELVIFDHNLAFDSDFNLRQFKNTHVASFLFKDQIDLFEQLIDRKVYEEKLEAAYSGLEEIISSIPSEWLDALEDSTGELERLRLILGEFRDNKFWEALI
ncbi:MULTISPECIES: HipA family kinase [Idiomarina]|uniref:HipA family kinase n=1 Tax=Idiomarina TaxID=135575 RepID=UPI000C39176E|nr:MULTISPECIES: HipA family kinase [Idiomarina]MBP59443.1 hypothetical protein [Idiomarina sp.]